MKILIVDDNAAVRRTLREMVELNGVGRIVGEATDGAEAVAMTEALAPDVVMMDVNMPVMDGIAATRQITARRRDAVVLALTTGTDVATLAAMTEAGASGFVAKGNGRAVIDALYRLRRGEPAPSARSLWAPHLATSTA